MYAMTNNSQSLIWTATHFDANGRLTETLIAAEDQLSATEKFCATHPRSSLVYMELGCEEARAVPSDELKEWHPTRRVESAGWWILTAIPASAFSYDCIFGFVI